MGMIFDTGLFEMMFMFIFFVVIGIFVYHIINGLSTWNDNNYSPRLTVEVTVISKRTRVDYHHQNMNNTSTFTSSTSYYVTFEVDSGDRMEFHVTGKEYGMLADGDKESLTFQGTRYQGFERRKYDA